MPFISDPNEEEDLDPSTKPVIAGGESAFAGGDGNGGAPSNSTGPAPTASGNFTNLQDYLGGNQAGEKTMADNLTTDVNGKTAAARAANAQYVGTASKAINSAPTGSDYNGPTDFSHLTGDALDAQTKARADTKTAADSLHQVTGGYDKLGSYLKDQVKDPGYTSGENGLDSFLVGASGAGRNAISGVKNNVRGDASKYNDAADAAVTGMISGQRAKPTAVVSAPESVADAAAAPIQRQSIPSVVNGVPTQRTLPSGIPNSIPGQVFNMPSEPKPSAPTSVRTSSAKSNQPYQLNRFAHGGLIEPEEKTPFSGLLSKLRKKQ